MFVKTVKVKKPNPLALSIVLIIVLALIAVWVLKGSTGGIGEKYQLTNNDERVAFLNELGWEVSEKETDVKVVKIPEKFNMVYTAYNKIQVEQGFNLKKYKGKTVEIYTYEVYNYPDEPEDIVAHLLICNNVLIGGDVCCTQLDGFMQGLMPTKDGDVTTSEQTETTEITETTETTETTEQTAITDTSACSGAIVIEE